MGVGPREVRIAVITKCPATCVKLLLILQASATAITNGLITGITVSVSPTAVEGAVQYPKDVGLLEVTLDAPIDIQVIRAPREEVFQVSVKALGGGTTVGKIVPVMPPNLAEVVELFLLSHTQFQALIL